MVCSVVYGYLLVAIALSIRSIILVYLLRTGQTVSPDSGVRRIASRIFNGVDIRACLRFLYTWIRCIPGGCFFQLFIIMVSDGQNVSNSSWVHGVRIVLCRNCVLERAEGGVCVDSVALSSPQRLTTIMKGSEGCPESDPTGNVMMIITELLYIS